MNLHVNQQGIFDGLQIELKPAAATEFQQTTEKGVGKTAIMVFNGKVISSAVIQSPLGAKFIVTGISKDDAQTFLNMLNQSKKAIIPVPE